MQSFFFGGGGWGEGEQREGDVSASNASHAANVHFSITPTAAHGGGQHLPPWEASHPAAHLMPEEMTRLRVASTVSCTAAVQFMAALLVT